MVRVASEHPIPGRCGKKTRTGFCEKYPVTGASVCGTHGGSAPQVKRAAAQRATKQEALVVAQRMVRRAGVDKDPIEHLLDSLHLSAQLVQVWGAMVAAIDEKAEEETTASGHLRGELGYEEMAHEHGVDVIVMPRDRLMAVNSKGEAKVHPYVDEYQKALERRAKFAKLCIDAGVAERQTRLIEQQVELAHKVFEDTLESIGLDAGKRQEARQAYGRHLRLVA
jgi:hypothetical protein